MALPTYRAKVGLTAGVTLEMLGGTRRVVGQQAAGLAGRSHFVRTRGLDAAGEGRFAAARGVRRSHRHDHFRRCRSRSPRWRCATFTPRERIPRDVPPRVTADLFVASGAILWEETPEKVDGKGGKGGQPIRLASSQRLSFDAQLTGNAVRRQGVAEWILAAARRSSRWIVGRRPRSRRCCRPTDLPAWAARIGHVSGRRKK